MNKTEVIQRMVEIAEEFNLQAIRGADLPESQVQQMIEQVRPQLYTIQGEIYEVLLKEGVIQEQK
jgi:hypothetical protein